MMGDELRRHYLSMSEPTPATLLQPPETIMATWGGAEVRVEMRPLPDGAYGTVCESVHLRGRRGVWTATAITPDWLVLHQTGDLTRYGVSAQAALDALSMRLLALAEWALRVRAAPSARRAPCADCGSPCPVDESCDCPER